MIQPQNNTLVRVRLLSVCIPVAHGGQLLIFHLYGHPVRVPFAWLPCGTILFLFLARPRASGVHQQAHACAPCTCAIRCTCGPCLSLSAYARTISMNHEYTRWPAAASAFPALAKRRASEPAAGSASERFSCSLLLQTPLSSCNCSNHASKSKRR